MEHHRRRSDKAVVGDLRIPSLTRNAVSLQMNRAGKLSSGVPLVLASGQEELCSDLIPSFSGIPRFFFRHLYLLLLGVMMYIVNSDHSDHVPN